MARTEKKFGQVNVAPAATYSTLVPSSANRRNIFINATATADDRLHLVTSSGTIGFTSAGDSATISLSAPSWAGGTFTSDSTSTDALAINPIGTRGIKTADATNGSENVYFTISPTVTNPVTFTDLGAGSAGTAAGSAPVALFYTLASPGSGGLLVKSPGASADERHISFTNMIKWASNNNNFVGATFSDRAYMSSQSGYNAPIVYQGVHSTKTVRASDSDGSPTNLGLPVIVYSGTNYSLANEAQVRALHREGAYYVVVTQNNYASSTVSGTGVSTMFKLYSYPESTTSFPSNWVGAIGYYNGLSIPTNEVIANFGLVDYNEVNGGFVCPSASIALTDPSMYFITVNSAGATLTSGSAITAAPAGFRLVDNSKYQTEYGLGYLTGVVSYPDAPTGVTVPATKFPTVSAKFSPNGKYIAVAYKRDYSGTGNTNSVVVVYTRQSNGTYLHTHSSGDKILFQPSHFDSMAWTPDSSGIITRSTDNKLYAWYPGITPTSISNYSFTYANAYPATPAFIASVTASGVSASYNAGNGTSRSTGISFFPDLTGATYLWSYPTISPTASSSSTTGTDQNGRIAVISPSATITATNYVNTVANGIPISANTVTQITGIVLEANERLEVDATTGARLNVNAYGVEIS
jgi:hypothetical protein